MPLEPPPFQEAPRCDACKCSFNTFRRRHHCRRCGRTLCHEHSSNQMALPQFGIQTNVRVCVECFNDSTRSEKVDPQVTSDGISSVTDKVSRLDIDADTDSKAESATQQDSSKIVIECKCGMPLCICEAPASAPAPAPTMDTRPLQMKAPTASTSQSNARAKKVDGAPKNRGSSSNSKPSRLTNELFQAEFLERAKICSSVFNYGQTNAAVDKPQMDYEASGEGLREAIKNGDTAAVKKLLSEGVDANYHDKQGLSLLHLAALFNRTDIAFTLMDSGASLDYKNAQGETPLDCAPATLQYKMRNKMGVSAEQGPSTSI